MFKLKKVFSLDTFQLLGAGFVFVWAVDFITKAYWYGLESFEFMYFCSILFLFGGIGFLFKRVEMLVAILTIALLFQLPWIADMTAIVLSGKTFNGFAGYIFSVNKAEYFIAMRHLFMIPALVYGISQLPRITRKDLSARENLTIADTVGIFLMGIIIPSLFAPPLRNINFSNMRIFPFWPNSYNMPKPALFFGYMAIVALVLAIFAHFTSEISPKNPRWRHFLAHFSHWFAGFGIIISVLGYFRLF